MACTCTEDKFLVLDNGRREEVVDGKKRTVFHPELYKEEPYDGVKTSMFGIVGRNRVMCQECIDNNARMEKQQKKQELLGKLEALEKSINYSKLTGDMYSETLSWADKKIADWKILKQEFDGLKE